MAKQPSCASAFAESIPYNFAERCRKAPVPAGFGPNGVKKSSGALYQKLPDDMAGAEGLEPSTKVLETHVLPLHHAPTFFRTECIIQEKVRDVNRKVWCFGELWRGNWL